MSADQVESTTLWLMNCENTGEDEVLRAVQTTVKARLAGVIPQPGPVRSRLSKFSSLAQPPATHLLFRLVCIGLTDGRSSSSSLT